MKFTRLSNAKKKIAEVNHLRLKSGGNKNRITSFAGHVRQKLNTFCFMSENLKSPPINLTVIPAIISLGLIIMSSASIQNQQHSCRTHHVKPSKDI